MVQLRRIVVKFGGPSIGTGERMILAASSVRRERVRVAQIAVVASAMGETTDELIDAAKKATGGKLTARELDEIIAMGERTSVRVFAAALRSLGVNARHVDPAQEEWPVVTDSNFGMARINLIETERRSREYLLPMMKKRVVPVICGFLGRDKRGNMTTLGRGGSDITAFLLGKCLGAHEVIVVKDVEGIMTADVNKAKRARLIERISVEELRELGRFGARVMHPRAMDYKDPEINARVIHFKHGDLSARGTIIVGGAPRVSKVKLHRKPFAMLTIVGEEMQTTPGVLVKAVAPLSGSGVNIFGVSIGPRSFSLYVEEEEAQRALELLHETVKGDRLMKSVTSEGNLAMIVAESEKFIYSPGMISKLTQPLGKVRINIAEILSSRASISLFVNWDDRERALELLRGAMRRIG